MAQFKQKVTKIVNILAVLPKIMVAIDMLIVVVNVIMRRFFSMPIHGATEVICYLGLATASLALFFTEWTEGNVKMTFVNERISERKGDILDMIINICCVPVMAFATYLIISMAISKYKKGDASVELAFPLWIPATILAIGFALITIVLLCKAIVRIYDVKNGIHTDFHIGAGEAAEAAEIAAAEKESDAEAEKEAAVETEEEVRS